MKMTQYYQFRCEIRNFKIHSRVQNCLHRKHLRVQHSKAQTQLYLYFFVYFPQSQRHFWSQGYYDRMKLLNGLTLRCLHWAEVLYIRTFNIKKSNREHTYSSGREKTNNKLYHFLFLRWHLRWSNPKCQHTFIYLVPLLHGLQAEHFP